LNILVTGGAGYVGSRLVPALVRDGHRVRVVDKLLFGAGGLASCRAQIELVPGDVRTVDAGVLDDIEAVVHLAGLSNDPTAEFNPAANKAMNTDATIRLASLARDRGVRRFVFASSCSVYYSPNPDDELRTEQHAVQPEAPYSWSKRQAELGLLQLSGPRFCPVVLRKGTIFGQSQRMRYDLVVNAFTRDAYAKRRLSVHAGGRMWRPMLHVDDAVDAYRAVLAAPADRVRGEIFNVLTGNYVVLKLAHEVRRALEHQRGIRLDLDLQEVGVTRSYRVDGSKLQTVCDVPLGRDLGRAAEEMWDVLESGINSEDPVYYNLRWLELLCDMEQRLATMGGRVF
jgi:nucleoside-diphosphate-sugar epimerase